VLVTFFSAIADEHDHIRLGGYPAPLRRLLGLRVEEFDPYPEGRTNRALAGEASFGCDLWSDLIDLEGAEALASYGEDFYAGRPAVTRLRLRARGGLLPRHAPGYGGDGLAAQPGVRGGRAAGAP
jgi:beta-galactosidase